MYFICHLIDEKQGMICTDSFTLRRFIKNETSLHSDMKINSNTTSCHQSVLDAVSIPIITTNQELTIVSINDATSKMLDMPSENILGKKYNLLFEFPYISNNECVVIQALKTYKPVRGQGIAKIKGRKFPVEYGAIPVANEQGQITSIINYLVDRTDRQLFFEEIRSLGDQIKSGVLNARADLTNFPDPYRSALSIMNEMLNNQANLLMSQDFSESQFEQVQSAESLILPSKRGIRKIDYKEIVNPTTQSSGLDTLNPASEKKRQLRITLDQYVMRSLKPRRRTLGRRIKR